jgi:hypothetical protein
MILLAVLLLSLAVLVPAVALDIWTNPVNVAERAHKRNAQMRFREPTQHWAMKTARNLHRHRRIY